MRTLRRRQLSDEQMHGRSILGRNPRLDRNVDVMKRILDGKSTAAVASAMEMSYTAVRRSIEGVMNEVLWETRVAGEAHPFTREKYPHAYDFRAQRPERALVVKWLSLTDLIVEKEFILRHMEKIQQQASQYQADKDKQGILKND